MCLEVKKLFPYSLIAILILAVVLSGCGGGNSGGGGTNPGQSSTYTVGGVSFKMRYVPSGSFTSDDNTISEDSNLPGPVTVANSYWMAETEVTYELWYTVYMWAKDNGYTFANCGSEGHNGTINYPPDPPALPTTAKFEPVAFVSWRDAMVWCNALTEYYYGNSANCVYYSDVSFNTPFRSVNNSLVDKTAGHQDNPYVKQTAKGFRLPTSNEWQLAARYQNGTNWTPGSHVSGDTTSYCYPSDAGTSTVFGDYAWVTNSGGYTHPVGEKTANALNIKDMSGNVWEWCFEWHPTYINGRLCRGASWSDAVEYMQLGFVYDYYPYIVNDSLGFRPVRTQ